jgi:toxin ParE1/3/4
MTWVVDYAYSAKQDLRDIYSYISAVMLEPVIAEKQTNRIMDAADSLDHMPLRYRLYDKEPWRSKGLRVLPVNNYLVLYIPDESSCIVTIIRIMYGGCDIDKHLNATEEM